MTSLPTPPSAHRPERSRGRRFRRGYQKVSFILLAIFAVFVFVLYLALNSAGSTGTQSGGSANAGHAAPEAVANPNPVATPASVQKGTIEGIIKVIRVSGQTANCPISSSIVAAGAPNVSTDGTPSFNSGPVIPVGTYTFQVDCLNDNNPGRFIFPKKTIAAGQTIDFGTVTIDQRLAQTPPPPIP